MGHYASDTQKSAAARVYPLNLRQNIQVNQTILPSVFGVALRWDCDSPNPRDQNQAPFRSTLLTVISAPSRQNRLQTRGKMPGWEVQD